MNNTAGSIIDSSYHTGEYFQDATRHAEDAAFKARHFLDLVAGVQRSRTLNFTRYADVGCGSGQGLEMVAAGLRAAGHPLERVCGYDVSPHVGNLHKPGVEFIHGDFCLATEQFSLVTLFDVVEHVPDPIDFLRKVAARTQYVCLHLPLDASLNYAARNKFRMRLNDPGHILLLDAPRAINLVTMAGLRPLDYVYTFGFETPGGRTSLLSKMTIPVKWMMARLSPWLMSATLGGASLMLFAESPHSLELSARKA